MKRYAKNFLIFLMIIITLFTFNITFSRYMTSISTSKDIIAVPILTLSNNTQEYVVTDMLPGDVKEYTFSVSNVEGNNTNEVLLSYCFYVDVQTAIPIEVKLYDITGGNNEELTITDGKTKSVELLYDEEMTKDYKLEITWNAEDNSYTYAGQEIICNINLEALQVVD